MRDFVVLAFIFLSAPAALVSPYYGILVWYFIAFLNPHRFAWSFAFDFPVALIIGLPTLVGSLFAKEVNRKMFTRESVILLMMWAWFCITLFCASESSFLSGHVNEGLKQLDRVSKVLLMTFVTLRMVTSKQRLRWLLLLVAMCFVFLGGKGGVWGLFSGGDNRVYGPEGSFIEDNNAFALACNMVMPLMFFLASDEPRRWLRVLLRIGFCFSFFAVIFTYSRGGWLGLGTVLLGVIIKSKHKIIGVILVALLVLGAIAYSPEKLIERFNGLVHGEVDSSAEQRLITWAVGLRLVRDYPITGGGFEVYPDVSVFQHYKPREMPGHRLSNGPHSIYMQMLGEQGFVGFLMFLVLIASCLLTLRRVRKTAKYDPNGRWALVTANSLEVGIAGFLVSGTFLGFAYFDLWYLYVICATALYQIYQKELRSDSQLEETRENDASRQPVLSEDIGALHGDSFA